MRVKEAEHGEKVLPGTAYLAPGHLHLSLRRVVGAMSANSPSRSRSIGTGRRWMCCSTWRPNRSGPMRWGDPHRDGKDGAQGCWR